MRQQLNILKAAPLVLVFSFLCACGGSPTGSSGNPKTAVSLTTTLTVSQLSLNFPGTTTVGNISSPQIVILSNNSAGSITISSVTAAAPFQVHGVFPPLTLGTGGHNVTASVFFVPSAAGAVTMAKGLTIVSDASNSPTYVSLTATGTASSGGTSGSACIGIPAGQTPSDVTPTLTQVASGITVTQLSNTNSNWNTYADIPAYSTVANVLTYNNGDLPDQVITANLDGTNAQVISGSSQGTEVQVTVDGKFIYYQGLNPDVRTGDIYAVAIAQTGGCQQIRLSNLSLVPIPPAGAIVISTSSIDPATGKNVIAFSEGIILHRVFDDGTTLPDVTLGDPENADVFHRMRLNPKFPNIMWYKRDAPLPNSNGVALPEIWVVDLNSPSTVYSVTGTVPADHASWSLDGTKLGYINSGLWFVADVLKSDGTFNLTSTNTFNFTQIGPPASSGFSVNYCNLSPDGSVYVCSQSFRAIYLMSLDGTQTKFLVNPEASQTAAIFNGIPKPRFLDMQHIIFSSDRTGSAEVYVMTGFTTTFP